MGNNTNQLLNDIKSELNNLNEDDITKFEEIYNKLSLLEKNKSLLQEELGEVYWVKAHICFKIYEKNQLLKEPYLEEEIRCLKEVIKLVKDKKQVYIKLIHCLIENDLYEALNLCNKIIYDKNFQNLEGLNTEIETIIYIKIDCLEQLIKDKTTENKLREIYNKEIIQCYDKLIAFAFDLSDTENKKKYEIKHLLEQKYMCLIEDKKEIKNIQYLLNDSSRLLQDNKYFDYKRDIYKYKLNALNLLNKHEDVIYCYEAEVVNEYQNTDDCFISYLIALYKLNRYYKVLDEIDKNININFGGVSYIKINTLIKIALIEKNMQKLKDILELLNSQYNNGYDNMMDFRLKVLNALMEFSNDENHKENFKNEIDKEYYKLLRSDKKLEYNHQPYSMFIRELLKNNEKFNRLYHYTDINALKGIIENKELWVTQAEFLNDNAETKHVKKIVDSIIISAKGKIDTEFEKFLLAVKYGVDYYFEKDLNKDNICSTIIKGYIDNNLRQRLNDTYILSLSTNRDSITLWGNYSKYEGYNIGFNKDNLINCLKNDNTGIFSQVINGPVIYKNILKNDEDIDADNIYMIICKFYQQCIKNNIDKEKAICATIGNIVLLGKFIKGNAFKQEEEYRIIFERENAEEDIKKSLGWNYESNFKVKNGSYIPFIKSPIVDTKIIEEINIGPNNKIDIAEKGLRKILNYNKYDDKDIEIGRSQLTLRY